MNYLEKAIAFADLIRAEIQAIILKQPKLDLIFGGVNLLTSKNSVIASSTAVGYLLEEFFASQLNYTREKPTTKSSYDFKTTYFGDEFLVNLKAEKADRNNNGVACLQQLYQDYCLVNPETTKHYLILKVRYEIADATIKILTVQTYYLENYLFNLNGAYKLDHRRTTPDKKVSGRLQLDPTKMPQTYNAADYETTKAVLARIYQLNS